MLELNHLTFGPANMTTPQIHAQGKGQRMIELSWVLTLGSVEEADPKES